LEKRLQAVENKGNGGVEARKEALSDWKQRGNGIWRRQEDGSLGAGVENSRPRLA